MPPLISKARCGKSLTSWYTISYLKGGISRLSMVPQESKAFRA